MLFGCNKSKAKYEVVNLSEVRESPGYVSASKSFDRPVYVDEVYMSWFRSYSDYKATVNLKITLEDDTQKTLYSVSNSAIVGGVNRTLLVKSRIKAIYFEMWSGVVGGNGIGYQLTFIAKKIGGGGRKNPFIKPLFSIPCNAKQRWERGVEHVVRGL